MENNGKAGLQTISLSNRDSQCEERTLQIPLFQIKERIKNMKKTQMHKLTALLLSICLTLPLFSMTVSAASGTEAIEYMKVSGTAVDSGIYAIVSSTAADGEKLRILHHTKNSTSVDRCVVKTAGETLTPVDCTVHPGTNAHSWVISASENGYTIQINRNNGRYINIDANGITAKTASPQYFQIQKNGDGYTISRDINGQKYYLTYDHENGWTSSTTAYKIYLYKKPVYAKISNRNVDDGFYSIVSSTAADGEKLRILHHTRDSVTVDRCQVKTDGRTPADTLAPEDCVVQPGTSAHHWLISASSNGYSIQINRNNGRYLNINADGLTAQTGSPQYFQIQQSGDGYTISRNISGTSYYLTYDNQNGWTSSTTPYKVYLYKKSADQTQIASGTPGTGTTQGQPFPSGTGGSANFRIPSLITLGNGNLAAAIDARWNHTGDACSLDTIFSISEDNGATWKYSFPNYFNDSVNAKENYGTAFIDPAMVQGSDGTLYLLVDLFPGGVGLNTSPMRPSKTSGYKMINGTDRLVLYNTPKTNEQNNDNYTHYIGDFSDGFAPVISVSGTTEYYVDDHYYLYNSNRQPIYCQQLGSSDYVQQNVFYYNADLHVRNACYLWLITSNDGGETWSAPSILNGQVRDRSNPDEFYGVGPGAGLCLEDGTIVFPCYTFTSNKGNNHNQIASFIYSTDNGKTWTRSDDSTTNTWSSESCLVQIDETTIRHFYRDGNTVLRYTDHTWASTANKWVAGKPVETQASKTSNNQISAIRYSGTIDGKTAIMVSTAAGNGSSRTNGKIYTFLLEDDKSMTLAYTYQVTSNGAHYGYSSLTEQADGSIGLLYENSGSSAHYVNIPITALAPGAVVDRSTHN